MGDWKTITVTERSSERLLPASFTSQVKMSPSNMQYTPLPHSRSSYRTLEAFCTSDNLDQCLSYLDQELTTLGYFSLYEDAEKENGRRELNVVSALNNMNSLLLLHRKNLRIQEDAEMQHVKLLSDMEHLQSIHYKQKDQLETSRKDLISIQEKDRQLQCKSKHLHQLLKNEKEEVQKLQNLIASRAAQYNHNIKRKEREYNKLKERLHQLVMDKKEKKMAIDILNYVGRADGKRSSWRTSKTDAKNEEEMYKVLLNDYEQRQKQFMVENAELKKVLQQMKKEMIYILTPRKQSKERSEDSFGTDQGKPDLLHLSVLPYLDANANWNGKTQVLSDAEEDVADSGKDNVSELTCEIAREQLTNSIRQQWRILKNHVEKLDNQVSLVQDGGGLKDQDVVKREVHEEEVEKLQAEIVQCSEIIKTQQQLLQQYFTNPCDDETAALLKGCYLLEDKERLQEEWRLFREQRKNFEQERRNFTEAAIRLGHEKQMFEEDRATWLKQQFLQMTSLIDLKNPERVKSPSACFENPEEEEYRFHGRSHQKKLHSAPAAVASRSAHKLLPSTPTMEVCNTPHPMPGESSRTVLLKRLELDGTPTWNGKEFTNLS